MPKMISFNVKRCCLFVLLGALSACDQQPPSAGSRNIEQNDSPEFKGKIAKSYEDSEEWWPPEKLPKKNAPNVIISPKAKLKTLVDLYINTIDRAKSA